MRVRAKGTPNPSQRYVGFYNYVRRKPGDVFDLLSPSHFSETWMERVEATVPKTPAPGEPTPAELEAQKARVEAAQEGGKLGKGGKGGKGSGDAEVI